MSPIIIVTIAIAINIPLMVLLVQLVILKSWVLGQQPYTSLLMFFGFIPLSFGIGLITVAIEVRKQDNKGHSGKF